ncbi:hypothetical protein AB1Y20_012138 [Prymnesium parvum]|uniref:Cilia- and flagella-associated protein 157 n=1 Tax=Prymnesium parvum TaxID=97485 RepID=A0AB34IR81_PRYPA
MPRSPSSGGHTPKSLGFSCEPPPSAQSAPSSPRDGLGALPSAPPGQRASTADENLRASPADEGRRPRLNRRSCTSSALSMRQLPENSVSTKLQLSELKTECESLRRKQVILQAQLEAARLEAKREAHLAEQSMDASERILAEHRMEASAVQERLESELHTAQDMLEVLKMEHGLELQRLEEKLEKSQKQTKIISATMWQRAFHHRLSRMLQERVRTLNARAEDSEKECKHVRDDLEIAQQALKNMAARTLQKALKSAMAATQGDVHTQARLHAERMQSEIRHMDGQMAEMRKALNEARRRCVRLQRVVSEHEEGQTVFMSVVRQTFCAELANQEAERQDVVTYAQADHKLLKRRAVLLALRLKSACDRERAVHEVALKWEVSLMRERQQTERLRLELKHAEARAGQMQAISIQKEQDAVAAIAQMAHMEKKFSFEVHRLKTTIEEMAEEHEQKVADLEKEAKIIAAGIDNRVTEAQEEAREQIRRAREEAATAKNELYRGDRSHTLMKQTEESLNTALRYRDQAVHMLACVLSRVNIPPQDKSSEPSSPSLSSAEPLRLSSPSSGKRTPSKSRLGSRKNLSLDIHTVSEPVRLFDETKDRHGRNVERFERELLTVLANPAHTRSVMKRLDASLEHMLHNPGADLGRSFKYERENESGASSELSNEQVLQQKVEALNNELEQKEAARQAYEQSASESKNQLRTVARLLARFLRGDTSTIDGLLSWNAYLAESDEDAEQVVAVLPPESIRASLSKVTHNVHSEGPMCAQGIRAREDFPGELKIVVPGQAIDSMAASRIDSRAGSRPASRADSRRSSGVGSRPSSGAASGGLGHELAARRAQELHAREAHELAAHAGCENAAAEHTTPPPTPLGHDLMGKVDMFPLPLEEDSASTMAATSFRHSRDEASPSPSSAAETRPLSPTMSRHESTSSVASELILPFVGSRAKIAGARSKSAGQPVSDPRFHEATGDSLRRPSSAKDVCDPPPLPPSHADSLSANPSRSQQGAHKRDRAKARPRTSASELPSPDLAHNRRSGSRLTASAEPVVDDGEPSSSPGSMSPKVLPASRPRTLTPLTGSSIVSGLNEITKHVKPSPMFSEKRLQPLKVNQKLDSSSKAGRRTLQ